MKKIIITIEQCIAVGVLVLTALLICFGNPLNAAHTAWVNLPASVSSAPSEAEVGVPVSLNSSACGTCYGSGQVLSSCAICGGDGVSGSGNQCHGCGGSGQRYIFCRTCGGDGRLSAIVHNLLVGKENVVADRGSETVIPLASCGLKCIENCGSTCTKAHHHMGFHKCGNGHTF